MTGSPRRRKVRRRPTHPGELLREETIPAAVLTPSKVATRLGVSRGGINELLGECCSVNPDLAHRLVRAFNTTPEFWLRLQKAVDVWAPDQVRAGVEKQGTSTYFRLCRMTSSVATPPAMARPIRNFFFQLIPFFRSV